MKKQKFDVTYEPPGMDRLIQEWKKLGYSKWSTIEHQMEFSIIEALLLEHDEELSYVGTSNIEYPSLPTWDIARAERLIELARRARECLGDFEVPVAPPSVSMRIFLATMADQLEHLATPKIGKQDASIAADHFLARCINDQTPDYET